MARAKPIKDPVSAAVPIIATHLLNSLCCNVQSGSFFVGVQPKKHLPIDFYTSLPNVLN